MNEAEPKLPQNGIFLLTTGINMPSSGTEMNMQPQKSGVPTAASPWRFKWALALGLSATLGACALLPAVEQSLGITPEADMRLAMSTGEMTGACIRDPGCRKVAQAQKEALDKQAAKTRDLLVLLQQVPKNVLPPFCELRTDPSNGIVLLPVLVYALSSEQMDECTRSANAWLEQQRQKEADKAKSYWKAAKWVKIEADNGLVFNIDVAHIIHQGGQALIFVDPDVGQPGHLGLDQFVFDCASGYYWRPGELSASYAPPRSVAGKIKRIACGIEKPSRQPDNDASAPIPAFCLSEEAEHATAEQLRRICDPTTHCDTDVNGPNCVRMRAAHARNHPEGVLASECLGWKVYEDPQPPGHPATIAQCKAWWRNNLRQTGISPDSAPGFDDTAYRETWGDR